MYRRLMVFGSILAVTAPVLWAATAAQANLSAAQIVDKNIAARGGLQAWRAVQPIWPLRLSTHHGVVAGSGLAGGQGPGRTHLAPRRAEGPPKAEAARSPVAQ